MATKKQGKDLTAAQKVGLGIGLTAAAVTAAGAYFLYGTKEASKNRKKVKSWALKAKAEVLEALEKAEHITEEEYHALIDAIGGAYSTVQSATAGEIKDFKKEMKDHWRKIEKSGAVQKVKIAATTAAKKAVAAKVAKKAPAKKAAAKKAAPKKEVTKKAAPKKTAKKAATKKVA